MNAMRVFKWVALVSAVCGVWGVSESADACGLRHRGCMPVCCPAPCPVVVVAAPVRVMPVVPIAAPQLMQPVGAAPVMGGPRVVVKKYKITKIRYKVPKRRPAPVVVPPVVCPVICPPMVCCPIPVICPPACVPVKCCPLRRCR